MIVTGCPTQQHIEYCKSLMLLTMDKAREIAHRRSSSFCLMSIDLGLVFACLLVFFFCPGHYLLDVAVGLSGSLSAYGPAFLESVLSP